MALVCTGGVLTTDNNHRPKCVNGSWEEVPLDFPAIDQLNEALEVLFVFDAELFLYIIMTLIITFISGWATGVLVRLFRN